VKGKVVLDIGTGQDAILARLCAEAGARKVYAVELLEESYRKAKARIDTLGLSERITLIHGDARQVRLPEPIDVCVSEIVGSIGGSEGAAVILNDARRFLKPGSVMIPSRSTTRIAAVNLPRDFLAMPAFTPTTGHYVEEIFAQVGYPFDLRLCIKGLTPADLVSTSDVFEDLDFTRACAPEYRHDISLTITKAARIDGLLVWLTLDTMPGEVIDALAHEHCWLPVYLPVFESAVAAEPGDSIHATISATLCENGLNPDYHLQGALRKTTGEVVAFSFSSHHFKQLFRHTPFYARLFAGDQVPVVEKAFTASDELLPQLQDEHVSHWRALYEDAYAKSGASADPLDNFTGWNSSYTGEPIPAAEMRQWVEHTVQRILAVEPKRILEIGCGSGLLLHRLAPHCEAYLGTDFSSEALANVRAHLTAAHGKVTLLQVAADKLEEIAPGVYDTIVINSVVQYFPDLDYLTRVIAGALERLTPTGTLFVGDLRNFKLLEAFHTSVELYRAESGLDAATLAKRVRRQMALENELLVDPDYFGTLKTHFRDIARVDVLVKQEAIDNELSRFRYDVVIARGPARAPVATSWRDWQGEALTLPSLHALLAEQPEALCLAGIPNRRTLSAASAWELINGDASIAIGALKQDAAVDAGVDPSELYELARQTGYALRVSLAGGNRYGSMRAVFQRPGTHAVDIDIADAPGARYANQPLKNQRALKLPAQLTRHLQATLPEYMVPQAYVLLDALPVTPNGKVDRRALPASDTVRRDLAREYVAARNATEELLAKIWSSILKMERVGVHDDFFELGGHSLLATQVATRIRQEFPVELPLRSLFEARTIAALAVLIEEALTEKLASLSDEEVAAMLGKHDTASV
jgi:cyclopropane fatty-acyl-phospholipid synthase-like methyltransferase/acyl carrier protein